MRLEVGNMVFRPVGRVGQVWERRLKRDRSKMRRFVIEAIEYSGNSTAAAIFFVTRDLDTGRFTRIAEHTLEQTGHYQLVSPRPTACPTCAGSGCVFPATPPAADSALPVPGPRRVP